MLSLKSTFIVLLAPTCVFVVIFLSVFSPARRVPGYQYTVPPLNESLCHKNKPSLGVRQGDKPLLTLFTSWPYHSHKGDVWNSTLENWAQLKPLVRPVFFGINESQREEILKYGWDVLPVRQTGTSDLPVLKIMFMDAICIYDSVFYGYSNGDILFDHSLISTLKAIAKAGYGSKKSLLVSGIRTNVGNLTKDDTDIRTLADVAKRKGQLFIQMSQDYFITDALFPWQDIPNVVIGRIGYDNWLLMYSRKRSLDSIDATETLLAFHQTTPDGNHESWVHKDMQYNLELLTKHYKYVRYDGGATFCTPFRSIGNSISGITVIERKELDNSCFPL